MKLFWFIPTRGDGRHRWTTTGGRVPDFDHLEQMATTVGRLANELVPTRAICRIG